jgi:hypothetical protein
VGYASVPASAPPLGMSRPYQVGVCDRFCTVLMRLIEPRRILNGIHSCVSVSCGLAQMSCSHRPHTHFMSWHTLSKVCAQAVPATQRVQCHCSFAGYLYERRASGSPAELRPSEVSTGRLCPSSYPKIPGRRISLTSPSLMMQPWPTRALSLSSRVIGLMRG